jgi:hypothetical protein
MTELDRQASAPVTDVIALIDWYRASRLGPDRYDAG